MTNSANSPAEALLRLKAGAGADAKRERLNLVNTTLFTRNPIRENPYTGEIFDLPLNPPVSLGLIEYPDGGAELFAVERRRKSSSSVAFEDLAEENGSNPQLSAGNLTKKMDPVARSRMLLAVELKPKYEESAVITSFTSW